MKNNKYSLLLALGFFFSGVVCDSGFYYGDDRSVSLETTLRRFYIIQRIDPFVHLMAKIKPKFWSFPAPLFNYDRVHYDGVLFCNEHILTLIDTIKKEQSINPVLHMWAELKRYKYLNDTEMVKEFTQLVFIVTRYSLKYQFPTSFEDNMSVKNIYILDAIESLSLDQILDILDVLVEDLPVFIEKYELDSTMTWKEWINKYWLVAPVAFSALIFKMYSDYNDLQVAQNNKK